MSTCNNFCPVWSECGYEHKGHCDCVQQRKFKPAPQAQEEPSGDPAPTVKCLYCGKVSDLGRGAVVYEPQPPAPASPAGLVWTRQAPPRPGWYWRRIVLAESGRPCSEAAIHKYDEEYLSGNLRDTYLWEYAGPIPEPAAPEGLPEGSNHSNPDATRGAQEPKEGGKS